MYRQIANRGTENAYVDKMDLRRIFAVNVARAMRDTPGLETQTALAKRAGISQPYLSELLRLESAPTTDVLAGIADALGCQPWELLADTEATRKAALEKMILGPRVPDDRAAEHLPPAPRREVAAKRKKEGGGKNPLP